MTRRGILFDAEVNKAGGTKFTGGIVSDFILRGRKVVVEVDGDYFHTLEGQQVKDNAKDIYYAQMGYRIVRIWEHDILNRLAWVVTERIGSIL